MKAGFVQLSVSLSHLVPSRRNPRKVKPTREAHQRLVALIRAQGLLQPLVVRPVEGKARHYEVVAGERRLHALREIHKSDGDPKIPCLVRDVDSVTADSFSLGENFGREAMHPLDEAEAFAKLATSDGKDAKAIAAEFGVKEHYVRQRMKLATLAQPIKGAYREGTIDTGTAEAFAAVPEDRQLEVWKEVGGHRSHPEHVRNIIANQWIDAMHAMFDLSKLPESAVSRDLFGDRVLVERQAFMEAQAQALDAHRQALAEEGWKEVVMGRREDLNDRLYAMDAAPREYDRETTRKLAKTAAQCKKLEKAAETVDPDDQKRLDRIQQRYEDIEEQERQIIEQAKEQFSEETKAVATSFLILDPDGRVHQEYRVPRQRHHPSQRSAGGGTLGPSETPRPPTSDDLAEKQLATVFTHEALAVRQAVLENARVRNRVLALILHEKIRSESLAIRHEANGTTLHASADGFASPVFDRLRQERAKLDPFLEEHFVEDCDAYERLSKLSPSKLDALSDLLVVECIQAHMIRRTELVHHLAQELKVNVRDSWRPDAAWLSSFQKIQLAHLIEELKGQAPPPERKKSELVEVVAKIFADAAEGKLENKQLAERVNSWLPSNLREQESVEAEHVDEE